MRTSNLWRSILVPVAVFALHVSVAVAQKSPSTTPRAGKGGNGGFQIGAGTSKQDQDGMQRQIQQIGEQLEEGEKARTDAWSKFGGDPEWKKLRAIPEYEDKKIVSKITNKLLTPTAYSQI